MPLELREILMIAGVLIVIVLIFDGIRRMRNASPRYQQKKYTKEKTTRFDSKNIIRWFFCNG